MHVWMGIVQLSWTVREVGDYNRSQRRRCHIRLTRIGVNAAGVTGVRTPNI